nr:RNA-dependent RNA polymerase [Sobelivirales sp.]
MAQVTNILEDLYRHARWERPPNWCSRERIIWYCSSKLNLKGSPGHSLCTRWPTNADVLKEPHEGGLGIEGVVSLVLLRLKIYRIFFELGVHPREIPVEVVSDPVRIFIKWEPHTREKAAIDRWRLIWSISLVDQIIDALIWEESLQAEVNNYDKIPSKPGFSPAYGGYDRLYRGVDDGSRRISTKDMSFWDWTMHWAWYYVDCNVRLRLCTSPRDAWFEWLAEARTRALCAGYVIFSDGVVFVMLGPGGIVRSGGKITISINSRGQVINRIIAELRLNGFFDVRNFSMACMGDDALERLGNLDKDAYTAVLRDLGFVVKYIDVGPIGELDFCSRRVVRKFGQWVPLPLNWKKHSFVLKCHETKKQDVLVESCASLCLEYAFDDERFQALYELMRAVGGPTHPLLRSQLYCQSIISGISFPAYQLRGGAANLRGEEDDGRQGKRQGQGQAHRCGDEGPGCPGRESGRQN